MVQSNESNNEKAVALHEEREKLADVIRHIDEAKKRLEGQMPAIGWNQETADAIQEILEENAANLSSALHQPYFGRLDYFITGGPALTRESGSEDETKPSKLKTIYIGSVQIRGKGIFSWTAPVGKLWYTQSYEDGYTAPIGYIPTRVDLKRYLKIERAELKDLRDIFRRALPAPDAGRDDVLTGALSGVGTEDGQFQVIIETIEPDQYENIANVGDKVLIVQGAAGSGKSEIGLHRIAYLLSPHNEIPEADRPTPETTLYIGPSQAFLEYASDILPQLGVEEKVRQVKFSNWRDDGMSKKVNFRSKIWDNLLAQGKITLFNEEAETFKGSLVIADVLDLYVRDLVSIIKKRCLELPPIEDPYSRESLSKDVLKSVVNSYVDIRPDRRPLNVARSAFINRIVTLLSAGRRLAGQMRLEDSDNALRARVVHWCEFAWPEIDFRDEYLKFLSDPERLVKLSRSEITMEIAEELTRSAQRIEEQGLGHADSGAMAYLDHLLNGTIRRVYRHIVIDEAQDMSPIDFKLLVLSSTNNWFTVLGDTAQRLTPYRGIGTWREVERVFGRSDIKVQHARKSYRATTHITRFNNRILKTFDPNIASPIPFDRRGNRVVYNQHKNTNDMYRDIIDEIQRIRSLEGMKDAVVAILVRDVANLNRFQQFCTIAGNSEIRLINQERHSNEKTVLARIPEVRGLEYDAVIVMGVNDSFSDSTFNKKLLYMATTRAKHYLSLHWSGKRSPILRTVSDRGVIQHLHGSRPHRVKRARKRRKAS